MLFYHFFHTPLGFVVSRYRTHTHDITMEKEEDKNDINAALKEEWRAARTEVDALVIVEKNEAARAAAAECRCPSS